MKGGEIGGEKRRKAGKRETAEKGMRWKKSNKKKNGKGGKGRGGDIGYRLWWSTERYKCLKERIYYEYWEMAREIDGGRKPIIFAHE